MIITFISSQFIFTMLYISRILNQYILGFFQNSASASNLYVDLALKITFAKMNVEVLRSDSPSKFLTEVSFERSLFSEIQKLFIVKPQKQFLNYFECTKKYSTGIFHQYFIQHIS